MTVPEDHAGAASDGTGDEDRREALYERLGIGEEPDEDVAEDVDDSEDHDETEDVAEPEQDVEDTDSEESEDEEAEDTVETDDDDAEDAESEEESEEEDTEDEAATADTPTEPAKPAESEWKRWMSRVPDDEWKKLPKVTKERINHLRRACKTEQRRAEELSSAQPFADYGKQVLDFAQKAKIGNEELSQWMTLGAIVNRGGEEAINALIGVATNLGYQAPQPTQARETDTADEDVGDIKMPPWLQKQVDDYQVSEEAAQEILKNMRPARQKASPPREPEPQRPVMPPVDPRKQALQEGHDALNAQIARARVKYGSRWDTMWTAIEREMLKHRGVDPRAWAPLFEKSLEVVELRRKKSKPRASSREQPLSASTGGGKKATPDESTMSPRERMYARARKL